MVLVATQWPLSHRGGSALAKVKSLSAARRRLPSPHWLGSISHPICEVRSMREKRPSPTKSLRCSTLDY